MTHRVLTPSGQGSEAHKSTALLPLKKCSLILHKSCQILLRNDLLKSSSCSSSTSITITTVTHFEGEILLQVEPPPPPPLPPLSEQNGEQNPNKNKAAPSPSRKKVSKGSFRKPQCTAPTQNLPYYHRTWPSSLPRSHSNFRDPEWCDRNCSLFSSSCCSLITPRGCCCSRA